jgi:hypothetical protein
MRPSHYRWMCPTGHLEYSQRQQSIEHQQELRMWSGFERTWSRSPAGGTITRKQKQAKMVNTGVISFSQPIQYTGTWSAGTPKAGVSKKPIRSNRLSNGLLPVPGNSDYLSGSVSRRQLKGYWIYSDRCVVIR